MTKHLSIFLLLACLLAGTAWGQIKILRTFEWNGRQYSRVQLQDGSTVEIKGTVGESAATTMTKATAFAKNQGTARAAEVSVVRRIEEFTADELVAELVKRKVLVVGAGSYGLKKAEEVKR